MSDRDPNRPRTLMLLVAVVAVVGALLVVLLLIDSDDGRVNTAGTTTTAHDTTTTNDGVSPVDPTTAVFPDPSTSRRFDDPRALVTAFAGDFLGYRDPLVGELREGDSRSGEVEVRAFEQGDPMTVAVRQLEDDTWFVLAATVENIRLDTPDSDTPLVSPQALEGAALAFEGTVVVHLYVDGNAEPIADAVVTGGGDEVRPFSGELTFDVPDDAEHGVLVLFEESAEDGSTVAATVLRVHF